MKKVIFSILFIFVFLLCFAGCKKTEEITKNNNSEQNLIGSLSNDNFEWENDKIIALTEQGAKQNALIIPAKCKGFDGMIFAAKKNQVKKVTFESDNDIDLNSVFGGACGIKEIILPKNLTKIADLEFDLCSSLEKIEIPDKVSSIGASAFLNNTELTKVTFVGNITTIKSSAFYGASKLCEIVIPLTTTTIGDFAFYKCTSLKTIALPASLTTVGEFVFDNSGLEEITVDANTVLEKYEKTSFTQTDHNIKVNVFSNSWIDTNFEKIFKDTYIKNILN